MLGIYLHIPFCTQRCVYCDFYFVTTRRDHSSFVDALCREIALSAMDEPVDTIYFGGGTPSRLSLSDIQRILAALREALDCSSASEITLEMNPEDADIGYLRGLRTTGINRISLGIQSFQDADLRFMHRSHTCADGEAAMDAIPSAGFENFTVDLIFGLPDQHTDAWASNLERVVGTGTPHISTYGLTIEQRTPLHRQVARGLVQPPSEDELATQYRYAMETLRSHGYEHYEISSFALPGFRAVHNQRYWNHADYLGFGPSAHSFRWTAEKGAVRWSNVRSLARYEASLQQDALPVASKETLTPDMLARERILLSLRTSNGLDLELLRSTYHVDLASGKHEVLAQLTRGGFIEKPESGRLRLTDRGKLVCDSVTARLIGEHVTAPTV